MRVSLPSDHNHTYARFKRTINRTHEPVIEMHKTSRWIDNGWNVVLVCFIALVFVSVIGVFV